MTESSPADSSSSSSHERPTEPLPISLSSQTSADTAVRESRPTLDVGIVVSPNVSLAPSVVVTDIKTSLNERYSQVEWNIITTSERLAEPPVDALDLMEVARDRMLDEDWDIVLVLTDLPLKDGKRTVRTQYSAVHGVGLLVVPSLGLVQLRSKVRKACVSLVEEILDFDSDDTGEDIVRRARQRADDIDERDGENAAQFAARVLGGNVGVLLGLVRANNPWTLALRLTRLIAATLGAGALLLITSDIWVLATNYGVLRLAVLSLAAIVAVTVSLILGAQLWEKPRRRGEREQVMLFNVATVLTVAIGVSAFYLTVLLLTLVGSAFLLDGASFRALSSHNLTTGRLVHVAWMVASLATLGGAVGAGLEEDDLVRAAAYTHSIDDENIDDEVPA